VKAAELKDKTIDELEHSEWELYDQLFKLRFQAATNQIENPGKIRMVRKDLARVKTRISEMRLAAERAGKSSAAEQANAAGTEESK
jgi:large subunit ribosomal protein L29